MSKPIEKSFGVLNPLFPCGDVLVVCGGREFWKRIFKRRRMPDNAMPDDHAGGLLELERKSGRLYVMEIPEADFSIDWYGTFAHEISHLVDHVTERVNAKDGETRAYLMDFYTRAILGMLLGIRTSTFDERHFKHK